jgi:pantoate--beta-alanine ligase
MTLELTSLAALRETCRQWKSADGRIALVATMGALHAGHLSLVQTASKHADRVIVSIFVNPTQFGPNEDFDRYPRPLARDLELLREAGADAAWLPTVEEMYPDGFATTVRVAKISEGLDGDHRPGHFDGVATVVSKLLLQVMPDVAIFGEKDYQQLCMIKRLTKDLNINCSILGGTTMRDVDGLALSSRNQYLAAEERAIAPALYAELQRAAGAIRSGAPVQPALINAREAIRAAGFAKIDYLELRMEDSLAPITDYKAPARLLVAAWLGKTRLIDNIPIAPSDFS